MKSAICSSCGKIERLDYLDEYGRCKRCKDEIDSLGLFHPKDPRGDIIIGD